MKKNIFLYSALALGMTGMFASCSSDDVVEVSGGNTGTDATAQVIEIAVDNTNSIDTRVNRPLNSEEPGQDIENVLVVITNEDNDIQYADVITGWNTDAVSSTYEQDGHGRKKEIKLEGTDKLASGKTYTIYAIGYSDESIYRVSTTEGQKTFADYKETLLKGSDFLGNVKLVNTNTTDAKAEEIFAGSNSAQTTASGGMKASVYLHRQVAGIYTYVKSVPYIEGADMLRLVAYKNNNLVLGNFKPETGELVNNGTNDSGNTVNGYDTEADAKTLYEINLKDWFGLNLTADKDNCIDANNWKVPERTGEGDRFWGCTFTKGSVFGGNFIIPFVAPGSGYSLQLQLVKSTNPEQALHTWNITMSSDDKWIKYGGTLNWWNEGKNGGAAWDTTDKTATKETTYLYSIMRNHLYGVGERPNTKPGDGDKDPDDDDDPDDNPQDLNNRQSITLKVNDNWEIIHQMGIE